MGALMDSCIRQFRESGFAARATRIIGFDRGRITREMNLLALEAFGAGCQSSSGVEQRTHKPLVGGSNPSSGTINLLGETHKMPVFTGVLCTLVKSGLSYL